MRQLNLLNLNNAPNSEEVRRVVNASYVPGFIKNIRGVKRFVNIFLLRYKLAHKEVEFALFFRFELLHFALHDIYQKMYAEREALIQLLTKGNQNLKKIAETLNWGREFTSREKQLMTDMFLDNGLPSTFLSNFDRYFALTGVVNYVSYSEFLAWTENPGSSQLNRWNNGLTSASLKTQVYAFLEDTKAKWAGGKQGEKNIKNLARVVASIIRSYSWMQYEDTSVSHILIGSIISDFQKIGGDEMKKLNLYEELIGMLLFDNHVTMLLQDMASKGWDFDVPRILSSNKTIYIGNNHPNLQFSPLTVEKRAIEYQHPNWPDIKNPDLGDSSWITRDAPLTWQECDDHEAAFNFERTFFFIANPNLVEADIFLVVDDECDIDFNDSMLKTVKNTGFVEPTKFGIPSNLLKFGQNKLRFTITNYPISTILRDQQQTLADAKKNETQFQHNPYGIRYAINFKSKH